VSLWLPTVSPVPVPADGAADPPALFVDRDGVIIEDAHYLRDPDGVRLLPGAAAALRRARGAGWLVVGISNQSGIGRGLYTEADFTAVQRRVDEELAAQGAVLDALYYCPHAPAEGCRCRKPAPGLLEEAAARFTWAPRCSWVVGDKASDVALARAAGLHGCLVLTGKGASEASRAEGAELICADLAAAVDAILGRNRA